VAARSAGQSPWIAPVSLLGIYCLVRYGLGALVAEYWHDYPWQAYPLLRLNFHRFGVWQYLPGGCHLVLVFGVGMLLGSLLALSRPKSGLPGFSWPLNEAKLKRLVLVCAPVAAFINALQFGMPLNIRFIVTIFGSFVYPLIMLGSYWLFTAKTAHERVHWVLYLIACCAMAVPTGLITGQVNGLLMPGIVIVLGYTIAKGAPPWKALAAGLPLVFLVVLPFSSLYKTGGVATQDIGQRIENTVRRFGNVGYRARLELALERTVMRFSGVNMPTLYARYYPNVYPFEYGASFAIEASALVPRLLWEGKPYASFELNRYPARIGIVEYEGNTTALFDAMSEYYLNFGLIGMFLLSILHGYYWQAIYKWLVQRVHPLIGAVLILMMIAQNEDSYGVGLLFTSQIKIVPVWILLFYFLSRSPRLAHR